MTASLTSLPLPILTFVVSAIAALLISRRDLGPALARGFFAGFFALIAIGSLMVGLRFGYGIEALVSLQRCLPLFGGPLLYLGSSALCRNSSDIRTLALRHFGFASLASLIIAIFLREWNSLDLAIGASYLFYAARLFGLWRIGANAYTLARLEIAPTLHRWTLWGALFLLVSMVWDTVIALTFALGSAENAVTIISYASLVLLACLIIVLVAFAKRLQLPSRALSSAINQSQGVNV